MKKKCLSAFFAALLIVAVPEVLTAAGTCAETRAACKEGAQAYFEGCRLAGGSYIWCWFDSSNFEDRCILGAGCSLIGD